MIISRKSNKLKISVIVVAYEMNRELPRTLFSLSHFYQRHILERDYEIIVVDNGSKKPFSKEKVLAFGGNFRYEVLPNPPASPAYAVNTGVSLAKADKIALLVDGARMVTPGFLHYAIEGSKIYQRSVVATLGWHLGAIPQQLNISKGYNQEVEDGLLEEIDWRHNGYRLFNISCLAPSAKGGCFKPIGESNALVVSKDYFYELGGYDESFSTPGGGFVNVDFYGRAVEDESIKLILLAGEGSFHQVHGGISTNVEINEQQERVRKWREDYERIRKKPFKLVKKKPIIFGEIPREAMPYIANSIDMFLN